MESGDKLLSKYIDRAYQMGLAEGMRRYELEEAERTCAYSRTCTTFYLWITIFGVATTLFCVYRNEWVCVCLSIIATTISSLMYRFYASRSEHRRSSVPPRQLPPTPSPTV
jgi:hypothetical protein